MKRFDFQVAANIRPQPFQNPPPTTTSATSPPAALHFPEFLLVALSDSLILGCTTNRPFFGLAVYFQNSRSRKMRKRHKIFALCVPFCGFIFLKTR
jgi:hypothetical protein